MLNKVFVNQKITELLVNYEQIWALGYMSNLADWDLNTYMPSNGAAARGKALAKLSTLTKRLFLDKSFIKKLRDAEIEKGLNDFEKGVVRLLVRDLEMYQKLPEEFLEELQQTTNEAHVVWREAKDTNDLSKYEPYLTKIVELVRKKSDYLGYDNHPYDALIDEYEEGWTTTDVDAFFSKIKPGLTSLFDQVLAKNDYESAHFLENAEYDRAKLERLNIEVLNLLNYNSRELRLDVSSHPFTQALASTDVRITTRYHRQDFIRSLMATIHEYGHALYELQIDKKLLFSPVGQGRSLGLHESQSRFWENMVGRNKSFIEKLIPDLRSLSDPIRTYIDKEGVEGVYKYMNLVRPHPLRVESDEISYHFHIMLRFECEKALVEGNLSVKDLSEYWNSKMQEYLGIKPRSDQEGVLQDIHWSMGAIGYFPTYSIGTFLSGMWFQSIESDLGNLDEILKQDESISAVQQWLRQKLHQYGSTYTFKDVIKKSLDKEFVTQPHLDYLERKFA